MLQTFSHSCIAWQPFHFFSPRSVPRVSEDQHKWIMQNNDEQTAEHASIFRRPKRNKQTATKLTQKSIWQKDSSYIVQIEVGNIPYQYCAYQHRFSPFPSSCNVFAMVVFFPDHSTGIFSSSFRFFRLNFVVVALVFS